MLLLKILYVNQLLDVIRPYYLMIFRFMPTLRVIWILPIISPKWRKKDIRWRQCQSDYALKVEIMYIERFWIMEWGYKGPPVTASKNRPGQN